MRHIIYWLLKCLLLYCALSLWDLVLGQIRYSIPEELQLGSFVGNVAEDLGLDVKQLAARSFRIVPGPRKQYLGISLDTGILLVKDKIDREEICGPSLSCVLSLNGLLENPLKLYPIAVQIIDVNDNAPSFPKRQFRFEISELSTPGSRFPIEPAYDSDIGTNAVQTYELLPNDYFIVEVLSSEGKMPVLVLQGSLDRESESSHKLTLIAKDGGVPVRSGAVQISIIVKDANDNAPVFSQSLYRVSLLENTAAGTQVIKLNATDLDDGLNGEINYSFGSHTSARVRELFGVDSKTGEMRVRGKLDYEADKVFEITVQAIDRGSEAMSGHCVVFVNIIDVNDNPPEVTLTSLSTAVSEGAAIGTVVALFSTVDKDSGRYGQVQCQISNKLPFKLDSSLENYYGILVQNPLDRENTSLYDVSITCSDAGNPPLTSEKTVRVDISDINDNAPRFTQSLYTANVMENNVIGASIFSITAFDRDVGLNALLKYAILETQVYNVSISTYVSINSETGVIFAQRSFDYEELKSFLFQVQVVDSGSPSLASNASVKLIILDQNDNVPVIVQPLAEFGATAVETISRFVEPGSLVAKVSATDADVGQNAYLSYSIFQSSNPNLFTISPGTGEIWTIRRIENKDATKQSLLIVVKDSGTPSLSATVTIILSLIGSDTEAFSSVSDSSEERVFTPELVFGQIHYSIPEELQLGSFVGNIAEDLGLDVKQLAARSFRIVPGPRKQYVDISLDTGILLVKESIDREEICGPSSSCVLSVSALLQNPLKLYPIAVEILDVNDNSPIFPKRQFHLEISELSTPGTRFPLEAANDPDVAINSVQTYELFPNNYFVLDVQMRDGEKMPVLVLQSSLDRETESSHKLTLIAKDSGIPVRSGTVQVLISVKDTNDNAPIFPQSVYRVSLLENAAIGTQVIKLNATDLDDGPNGKITYSLSSYNSAKAREKFSVDSKTGEIRVRGKLDYEENTVFEINIKAIDGGSDAMTGNCDVLVNIIDVNDNPPEVTLTTLSNTISEDAPVGTVVALFSATDKDSGRNGQIQCKSPIKLPFRLDSSLENYYGLIVQDPLDRENTSKYDVTVTCMDAGNTPLSSKNTIRVEISDINDNAPKFTQSLYKASVMENNDIGVSIFSISAFDPDIGLNARLKYSILKAQIHNASVSTYISINSETGVIFAQRSFDYEKLKNFQIKVEVMDSGSPPLASNVSVDVVILDQNDNVPVIVQPLVEFGSTIVETISRFAEPGYLVTKVSATDADGGQNGRLSYSIFQATHHNLFTISPDTGEIWTIRRIGSKDASKQILVILVKDNGKPSLSSTVTISLSVVGGDTETFSSISGSSEDPRFSHNLSLSLVIALGVISIIFLVILIILAVKVHKSRNALGGQHCSLGSCCCLETRHSLNGIQKASRNLQIPPNYVEVFGGDPLSQRFRYESCSTLQSTKRNFITSNTCKSHADKKYVRNDSLEKDSTRMVSSECNSNSVNNKVTVEILDVNDNVPSFPNAQFRLEISELSIPGTRFPLEPAHDLDVGTNSVQTYELLPSNYFNLDVQMRSGNVKSPVLVLQTSLDRETESRHILTLVAKDGGVPVRSGTAQVTIIVNDANDNAPAFPQSVYRVSLLESAAAGTQVIILNATDLDDGANGEINYSFGSHTSTRVRELFGVDSKTGEIRVKRKLDYEENSVLELNIQATDGGLDAMSGHCDVLVNIIDVNDNPPVVKLTSLSTTISEDAPIGTVVSLITAIDEDSGSNGQVECYISNELPFKLDSSLKNYYGIIVHHQLDRENTSKYDVTITCTDAGHPPLTSEKTIRVEISDINDNAPHFRQSLFTTNVMENNDIGASIFTITAFDADIGVNARLKYSLLETQIQNSSVFNYISINSDTGVILAQRSFDYEESKHFQIQAYVMDSGTPSLANNVSVDVIILDQNDNAPVIVQPLVEFGSTAVETISRFAEPGYLVAKVSATDADAGQNARLSYSILQATQHNLFTISPDSGEIWTIRRIISRDAPKQRLVILVKDNGTPSLSASVTITLSVIGGDAETLSNVIGSSTDPGFSPDMSLSLVMALGTISSIFLIILIILAVKIRYLIPEELQLGAFVGNIAEDLSLDIKQLSARNLRIVAVPKKQYVDINLDTGILIVTKSIDREEICGQSLSCTLNLDVFLENPLKLHQITVEILDINDNAPSFPNAQFRLDISERSIPGTRFPLEPAHDLDVGTNSVQNYELFPNDYFVLDVQMRSGNVKSPVLVLQSSLDRETETSHRLTLIAKDGGVPVRSGTAQVTIIVNDANDNAPVFPQSVYRVSLLESAASGTQVIILNATDLDDGTNGEINYSFGSHTSTRVRELFGVDSKTGEIRVKQKLDYEENSVLELNIQATDGGSDAMSGHCDVLVNIIDVNDNPPDMTLTSLSSIISEDAPVGTSVALFAVADKDSDRNGQVQCRISNKLPFKLDSSLKNYYGIIVHHSLDRETISTFDVTVTCTDFGNPPLSSQKTIRVEVSDINDNAPHFRKSLFTANVMENNDIGASIFSITAFDADIGVNARLKYSILDSLIQNVSVFNYVSIKSDTGVIFAQRAFDYEELKNFQFQAQVMDSGTPSLANNVSVDVIILDQNDNAPVIVQPLNYYGILVHRPLDRENTAKYDVAITCTDFGNPPLSSQKTIRVEVSDINDNAPHFRQSLFTANVLENNAVGASIFSITAFDADIGVNARLKYSILETQIHNDSVFNYISINSDTGVIFAQRSFDYEELKNFQFHAQVMDSGTPSLANNVSVDVIILDQNDNAPVIVQPLVEFGSTAGETISRFAEPGSLVTKVSATDADAGQNARLSYSIFQATQHNLFTISRDSGEIWTIRRIVTRDAPKQRLVILVKDNGSPSLSASVTIILSVIGGDAETFSSVSSSSENPSFIPDLSLSLVIALGTTSSIFLVILIILAVKIHKSRNPPGGQHCSLGVCCCLQTRHSLNGIQKASRNIQIPPNYVEVLGGDPLSQSFRYESCSTLQSTRPDYITPNTYRSSTDKKYAQNDCIGKQDPQLLHTEKISNPLNNKIRYLIPEELQLGAFVGNIAEDLSLDIKQLSARNLRIVAGPKKQYVDINLDTGILIVTKTIDREEICGPSLSCALSLDVFLENPLKLYQVTVEILDVNDNAPSFPNTQFHLEMSERTIPGTRFPLESAHDLDVGTNSVQTYELLPNDYFILDVQMRGGKVKSPVLVLQSSLDREKDSSYRFTLTAKDGGVPVRTGTSQVIIIVKDVNDHAPIFPQSVYRASLLENATTGRQVIRLNASDLDDGANGEITYSFVSHTSARVREMFAVNSRTGEISVKGKLDYEENDAFEINIQATDGGPDALSGHCEVLVNIIDVNDNPPEVTLTSLSSIVSEDAPDETVVALFTAADKDSGTNGQVQCHISNKLPFKLDSSLKNYYGILVHRPLDRENTAKYDVTIKCSDAGNPPLTSEKTIQVEVSDINDNAPYFRQSLFTANVMENNKIGASIFFLTAFDADIGMNARLKYSLLDTPIQNASVFNYISINSDTGVIFAQKSFDYEELKNFQIQAQVMDSGTPSLTNNVSVDVIILDQNDNAPVIVQPLVESGTTAVDTISRFAEPGSLVAKVSATDADAGQNARLSYSIFQATQHNLFTISPDSGEIWTIRRIVAQDASKQRLVILVKDNGSPSLSASVTIILSVIGDDAETLSNVIGPSEDHGFNPDLSLSLVIALGAISSIFFVILIILAVKVHKSRSSLRGQHCSLGVCCCLETTHSLNGIQKASRNLQIPPNYVEVFGGDPLSQSFRYESCSTLQSTRRDFIAPNTHRSSTGKKYAQNDRIGKPDPELLHTEKFSNPLNNEIRYSIPEELQPGAFVGNIANDLGLRAEQLTARNFRVVSGPRKQYLEVNLNSGILFVKENIDREQLCGSGLTCMLSLEAVIENPLTVYHLEVEILDVNDNAPRFPNSQFRLKISELAAPGARFALEYAHDPDVGTNSVQTYQLVANDYFALNIDSRGGDGKLPVLVLERPLDREIHSTHQLELIAKDGGIPPKSGTAEIIVVVQDENDNAPAFPNSVYKISLLENAPKGTLVIKLNATDMDDGSNGEVLYSFSSHTSVRVRELFSVDSKTGEIRVKGILDYEKDNDFEINMQALDQGINPIPEYCHILVNIIDVNDNAPEVILTSLFSPLSEDSKPGTVVALISVSDRDSGENGQVTCEIANNLPFRLDSSLRNYYRLLSRQLLDRENASKYDVGIRCSDSGSPPLTARKTIRVEISDINDNAPRFTQTSYTAQVMENNAVGTSIFAVTALDPDLNQNARLSYSILDSQVHNEPVSTFLSINSKNGVIYSQRTFDYEQLRNFQVQIQARDSGEPPLTSNASVDIIILDQNDHAPVIIHPSVDYGSTALETVSKFAEPGYLVTKVTAMDVDSGQNGRLFYQILQSTDPGLFTISPDTGEIWTIRGFASKDAKKQRMVVSVNDNGTPMLSATMTLILSVVEGDAEMLSDMSNLSQDSGEIRYTIPEELQLGAFIGNIADDLGLDVQQLAARNFRLVSGPRQRFVEVSLDNGIMFVNEKIDRELICGPSLTCVMSLEAVIENPLNLHQIEVKILDINDNAPSFAKSQIRLEISEVAAPGTRFALECAHDPDVGTNSVQTYQLVANEYFLLNTEAGMGDGKLPVLVLEKPLDREKQSTHRLLLLAKDGGVPERSGTAQINIIVEDANDNTPLFPQSAYRVSLAENVTKGALVLQVNATDLDDGSNGEILYSFSSHTSAKVRELFGLDSKTGEIRTKANLDYEDINVFELIIQAKDKGLNANPTYCHVVLNIIDVNDNAPEVTLTSLSSPVPEDSLPGTVVALISASDKDSGAYGQLQCKINNHLPFALDSSSKKYLRLITQERLDRESVSTYEVTITCNDGGIPPLSANKTILIEVSDKNDNTPQFAQPSLTAYVMENNKIGASILSVSALDPDLGQNGQLSYSILESQVQGESVSRFIHINAETGVIYSYRSFDYEQLKKFQVQVQAHDRGVPPLASRVSIDIIILDQNDNAPVIVHPITEHGATVRETLSRLADPGHLVAKVTATDADSGQNARLSYRIHDNNLGLFTISLETGEIWTTRRITKIDSNKQKLVIFVNDNGTPALTATMTIILSMAERSAEMFNDPGNLAESPGLNSDTSLYLVISLGIISSVFLVVLIILAVKVHESRTIFDGHKYVLGTCCCFESRNGIQKASRNLQITPNYVEVFGGDPLSQSFRYDTCSPKRDLHFPNTSTGKNNAWREIASNGEEVVLGEVRRLGGKERKY
ncbi:hypothetical protein chiPu_0008273 [Chiloscyllium punctatum]|uniref:Cadherin domain-containing protein n=1 Tax=Chiloscyllium punctatum TaxID=137246 RepID=A0A401SHF7_CHIPU|nr:hypothetical protein [Chiloscyllium punctatum]